MISLIERAAKFGTVAIITNAETGWVEMSCKKFMPRVLPSLAGMRIPLAGMRVAYLRATR